MGGAAQAFTGSPKWDLGVKWHRSLAVALMLVAGPLHPGFFPRGESTLW